MMNANYIYGPSRVLIDYGYLLSNITEREGEWLISSDSALWVAVSTLTNPIDALNKVT